VAARVECDLLTEFETVARNFVGERNSGFSVTWRESLASRRAVTDGN